jgi:AmmeMemoRadiSam system protein B
VRARRPAVAGTFYPDAAEVLGPQVDAFVAHARRVPDDAPAALPKAIVVPHAGYVYSGPIAGTGYAAVAALAGTVRRVVLLGPAHRVPLEGLAVPSVDAFDTPLGPVTIDTDARATALGCAGVVVDDLPHGPEHSLEVHLPFLLRVLGPDVRVLPIVVGHAPPAMVAAVLDALWGGPETLVVVSSDLSHYERYDDALAHDRRTADAIVTGAVDAITPTDACGAYPVRGLLTAAARHALDVHVLDLRNSGDTAGPRDRVVGYGAFALVPR